MGFKQVGCVKICIYQSSTYLLYKERLMHRVLVRKIGRAVISVWKHDLIHRTPGPLGQRSACAGKWEGRPALLLPLAVFGVSGGVSHSTRADGHFSHPQLAVVGPNWWPWEGAQPCSLHLHSCPHSQGGQLGIWTPACPSPAIHLQSEVSVVLTRGHTRDGTGLWWTLTIRECVCLLDGGALLLVQGTWQAVLVPHLAGPEWRHLTPSDSPLPSVHPPP